MVIQQSGLITCQSIVGGGGFGHYETRKYDTKGPSLEDIKSAALHINPSKLAPASYVKLAKEMGVTVSADEAALLQAIHDADLPLYDFSKVDGYLYRKAIKASHSTSVMRWAWKPMRHKDLDTLLAVGESDSEATGLVVHQEYVQAVPMKAMEEAKAILASVPDAMFMVSDYVAIKPDPFLAVTTPELLKDGKIWIIDCWGEPGFGSVDDESVAVNVAKR